MFSRQAFKPPDRMSNAAMLAGKYIYIYIYINVYIYINMEEPSATEWTPWTGTLHCGQLLPATPMAAICGKLRVQYPWPTTGAAFQFGWGVLGGRLRTSNWQVHRQKRGEKSERLSPSLPLSLSASLLPDPRCAAELRELRGRGAGDHQQHQHVAPAGDAGPGPRWSFSMGQKGTCRKAWTKVIRDAAKALCPFLGGFLLLEGERARKVKAQHG